MLFNSWIYGFFLPTVFLVYWNLPRPWMKPYWLILCGIAFYTHYYPPHILLILALTLAVFAIGRLIEPRGKACEAGGKDVRPPGQIASSNQRWARPVFIFGLVLTGGALAYYKYQGFFVELYIDICSFWSPDSSISAPNIRAPLAISFFTFEFVHYLIEVRRGRVHASFRDFALFIFFFPTLVAGPIKRFYNFEKSLDFSRRIDWPAVGQGMERILFGLAKKIIVADTVARLTAPVWADPEAYSAGILWLAAYGYALQIYFDFSGYSDIAIGSAAVLGFKVEENFDYPYLRRNISEFWRCWHMSLTSWIGDYLYIPLGGNRLGRRRAALNRFIAMGLCGLWHGSALHFVVWGLYHAAGINVLHLYRRVRDTAFPQAQHRLPRLRAAVATVFTFHFVVLGWVFFVLDIGPALSVIKTMLAPAMMLPA